MNKLEQARIEAVELVNKVWNGYEGYEMHDNTFNAWFKAKNEYLTAMFGDKLILEKDVVVELRYEGMTKELEKFQSRIIKEIEKEEWYKQYQEENRPYSSWRELKDLLHIRALYDNSVKDKTYFDEKRKFLVGEKITRGLKKLISDAKVVSELQIAYSQMMNTRKLAGKLCLSIHPLDFLTMSHTSSWGSCYDLFNEGEYRAGTLEYMCSKNTICAYLYTKEQRIAGNQMWNDKKWRSIITVEPNDFILTGKGYPYKSDELTGLAYEWVRELMPQEDFPKFEDTTPLNELDRGYDVSVEYGYNDAESGYSEYFNIGMNKARQEQAYVSVSYGSIPCPRCGAEHHIDSSMIVCEDCDDSFYCECCDDRCTGDSYEVTNRWGDTQWVCYSCLDYYYRYCEECEEYHYYDDMTLINDKLYCESCRDEKFHYCERCEEYVEVIKHFEGDDLCEDCYQTALAEKEEEEEEEA